jgi:hypothetical protein
MQAMESTCKNYIFFKSIGILMIIVVYCSYCFYRGPIHIFLLKKNGSRYIKACLACNNKKAEGKENIEKCVAFKAVPYLPPSILALTDCFKIVSANKNSPFKLDTFVVLSKEKSDNKENIYDIANTLYDTFAMASDYHWK